MILTLGGTGWFNHRGVCHHSLSLYICCNGGSTLLGDSYHAFVPFHVQLCGASSVVSTVACSKETIKFLILQSGPYYSIMSRIRWSQNVHNCEWYHCSNEHITAVILNHLQLCISEDTQPHPQVWHMICIYHRINPDHGCYNQTTQCTDSTPPSLSPFLLPSPYPPPLLLPSPYLPSSFLPPSPSLPNYIAGTRG